MAQKFWYKLRYKKRTVNRLVDTVHLALAVRDARQTRAGQQTQRARNHTRFIRDNVTEQVAGDDDAVQLAGVLNHDHRRRVDQLVVELQLRELLRDDLGNDLAPQTARSKNICLVERPDGQRRVMLQGQMRGKTGDPLDLRAGVWFSVQRVAVAGVLLALAKVNPARQLSDDVEVDIAANVSLQRRDIDQRWRGEIARSEVAKGAHFLAQLQQALLGPHSAGAPFLFEHSPVSHSTSFKKKSSH